METRINTGQVVTISGDYKCESHPKNQNTFKAGQLALECSNGNHRTTWIFVEHKKIELQTSLALIDRKAEGVIIEQRATDGYINATHLCDASYKNLADYLRLKATNEFCNELISDMGIPMSALIQIVRGGNPKEQGTWVHPQVAINLAQWASPKFAVLISKWVFEWLNGTIPHKGNLPYHIQRYLFNRSGIPFTHFSMLNEMIISLIAPLEDQGYRLPANLVPDISEGKMFSKWLRDEMNIEPSEFPTYMHKYPDGREFPARLYPNYLLAEFKKHFNEIWLRNRAISYFSEKDGNALPYLEMVIKSLPAPIQPKKIEGKKKDDKEKPQKSISALQSEIYKTEKFVDGNIMFYEEEGIVINEAREEYEQAIRDLEKEGYEDIGATNQCPDVGGDHSLHIWVNSKGQEAEVCTICEYVRR